MRGVLLAIAVLLMAACSGRPGDGEVERQVRAALAEDGSSEYYAVENVTKTNGFERDPQTYVAEVRYDIVFRRSAKELSESLGRGPRTSLWDSMARGVGVMALTLQYGNFKAGDRFTRTGRFTFVQSDNGWVLTRELPEY
jgi:hypothetical protein